jgi:hypothetical protein
MSLIGGCSAHPDLLTLARTSVGAPQFGHEVPVLSLGRRQYGHV